MRGICAAALLAMSLAACQTTTPSATIDQLTVALGGTVVTATNLVFYRYKPAEVAGAIAEGLAKGAKGSLLP